MIILCTPSAKCPTWPHPIPQGALSSKAVRSARIQESDLIFLKLGHSDKLNLLKFICIGTKSTF